MSVRSANRVFWFLFVLGALLSLAACNSNKAPESSLPAPTDQPPKKIVIEPSPAKPSPYPRTVTDSRGKTLTFAAPPQRIVSLAPSNTELLYALGADKNLVADTTACDYPPAAKNKPHVGGFAPSVEAIEAQNPDLVVAVGSINGKIIEALEKAKVPVLSIEPKTVADVYDTIKLLGVATGQDAEAAKIVLDMQARIEAVRRAVSSVSAKPKVFICYGVKPTIYTTGPGSFIDDLITISGGKNIVETPAPAGNILSAEKVVQAQPDVIICGKEVESDIKAMPGWATGVPAVKNGKFFHASESGLIERPGPRLAQGAEELAYYLHPEVLDRSAAPK